MTILKPIPGVFAGARVVVSRNWPQVADGHEIIRRPAHGLVRWFARFLPITPHVEWPRPKFKDAPLIAAGGTIHCSARQYRELKDAVAGLEDSMRGW